MLSGKRLLHAEETPIQAYRHKLVNCPYAFRVLLRDACCGLFIGILLVLMLDALTGKNNLPSFVWNGAASTQCQDFGQRIQVAQPQLSALNNSWIRRMAFRKQRAKWACQHFGGDARTPSKPPTKEELHYLWVNDDLQIMYCEVPKVASTSWKTLILEALGIRIPVGHVPGEMHRVLFPQHMRRLSNYSSPEIEHILKNYLKFMILRHPTDRLVSAYRDKIEFWKPSSPRALSKVASYVYARKGLPSLYPTDMPQDDVELYNYIKQKRDSGEELWNMGRFPSNITFREFVQYVADNSKSLDKHCTPAYRLCHPCFIDYDIISYFETLQEDAEKILQLIEYPSDLKLEKKHFTCHGCKRTSKMFERVYEPEMSKFKNIFDLDWKMELGETDFRKSP